MLKKVLLIAVITTALVSCGNKKAVDFNNKMVGMEKDLEPVIMEAEAKIVAFAQSGQFDSMQVASAKAESQIGEKMKELEALPVPNMKEADNMKAEYVRYFRYIQGMYASYKEVAAASTDEDRAAKSEEMMAHINRKDDVLNALRSAQKKFADANNLKLQ